MTKWTEALPFVEGYYWAWVGDDPEPEIVEVWSPGGVLAVAETSVPVKDFAQARGVDKILWYGPINPPRP